MNRSFSLISSFLVSAVSESLISLKSNEHVSKSLISLTKNLIELKKTLFLPFGPQHFYVHNYTIFYFIYKDDIYENPLLAKQNKIFLFYF